MEDYSKIRAETKELRKQLKEVNKDLKSNPNILADNDRLQDLELPDLKTASSDFLSENEHIGDTVMHDLETNNSSSRVNSPNFLANNDSLKDLELPDLKADSSDSLADDVHSGDKVMRDLEAGNFGISDEALKALASVDIPELSTKNSEKHSRSR